MTRDLRPALAAAAALSLLASAAPAHAQDGAGAHYALEKIHVFGPSLEGNLEGDDPAPEVHVFLPPSYATDPDRRYPVVYMLHGYALTADSWDAFHGGGTVPYDMALADGAPEMIYVTPNADTVANGSMYSNSVTVGDWESYVAEDLVGYIDSHYRTLATRESRGLAGHSMGGYGVWRIAMKKPGVFSSVYAMSACCLSFHLGGGPGGDRPAPSTPEELKALGFGAVMYAQAAAWSPNPDNPPFYFDMPVKDGETQLLVQAEWAANAPNVFVHQYVPALKSYDAIGMEIGLRDGLLGGNQRLHEILESYGVAHDYLEFEGDHVNHLTEHMATQMAPFFAAHLKLAE